MTEKRKLNRRKFFGITSVGLLGAAVFSSSPLKFFDRTKRYRIKHKVNIHPSAVKRNK